MHDTTNVYLVLHYGYIWGPSWLSLSKIFGFAFFRIQLKTAVNICSRFVFEYTKSLGVIASHMYSVYMHHYTIPSTTSETRAAVSRNSQYTGRTLCPSPATSVDAEVPELMRGEAENAGDGGVVRVARIFGLVAAAGRANYCGMDVVRWGAVEVECDGRTKFTHPDVARATRAARRRLTTRSKRTPVA